MGHSSVRITQDIYVSPDGDLYERFFEATKYVMVDGRSRWTHHLAGV